MFREDRVTSRGSLTSGTSHNGELSFLDHRIGLPVAFAIYVAILLAIYWPVFLGQRFFWEDFFILEYPIREYCYYMAALKHALPFWDPYSWANAPLLADAQCGFWYPTNLLQIAFTKLLFPGLQHLPVLVTESATLLHLPIAALGVFQLTRKQFKLSDPVALLAGLTFGFGLRMAAEQNHAMQVLQLALLPWETYLIMSGWSQWRYAVCFGLLFGVSFFAGQPQTFFFIAIFLTVFTLVHCWQEYKTPGNEPDLKRGLRPLMMLALGMIIAAGTAAIQLLPSSELAHLSARAHLPFKDASGSSFTFGHFLTLIVPKLYGDYVGFGYGNTGVYNNDFWHWEATFGWSLLAEVLALFAVVTLWHRRKERDPQSRYVAFVVIFSLIAIGYAMGNHLLVVQWFFWKFIPFFDQFRAPGRIIWFVWFLGTIYGGIGLELIIRDPEALRRHRRFFLISGAVILFFNIAAITGLLDLLIYRKEPIRQGLFLYLLPSLIVALTVVSFLVVVTRKAIRPRLLFAIAAILIFGDLYYNDITWHRNTVNREDTVRADSSSSIVRNFAIAHRTDHAKLLLLEEDSVRKGAANLGMFLRLPIEYAIDSEELKSINPMRIAHAYPLIADSIRRMEIMGVAAYAVDHSKVFPLPDHLPYLKMYHSWQVANDDSSTIRLLNNPSFNIQQTVLLNSAGGGTPGSAWGGPLAAPPTSTDSSGGAPDSVSLVRYSENEIEIRSRSIRDGVLLINDLYYPAWKAYVDGRESPILRAFGSLRAVSLSQGDHRIVLRYESTSFAAGWKITVLTMLLGITALLVGAKRKTPEKPKARLRSFD